jgi:hypothetical protein
MTTFYIFLEWTFVGVLCLVGLLLYRAHQERKEREQQRRQIAKQQQITLAQQQLTIDYHQASVNFAHAMTHSLQTAVSTGVNHKAKMADRELEVMYQFPSSAARTQVTMEPTAQPAQLAAPGVRQPTQRYLIDQLEENALQVCPGIRTSDGQPVILSIPDAVHFKLIGSSGFGKSCLAGAILDQAIKLNSPDVLQIALLDLEHKTSRLFENAPNVATLQTGRRSIPMVATNADEVASQLGLLKKELDRRAQLSEYDLQSEPLLLIYVEEMLSLQFEVDETLIVQMLKDLSVLAVRARKYRMDLLAVAQTDYSTKELQVAQKQFRSRIAFAIDTTAARAAGFMSTELIKYSFSHSQRGDGMYVLETPGVASLMLAPVYDVRAKVLALDTRSGRVQRPFSDRSDTLPERIVNADERTVALRSERSTEVHNLLNNGWGKQAIIEKLWQCKKGGSPKYKEAEQEYNQIIEAKESEA